MKRTHTVRAARVLAAPGSLGRAKRLSSCRGASSMRVTACRRDITRITYDKLREFDLRPCPRAVSAGFFPDFFFDLAIAHLPQKSDWRSHNVGCDGNAVVRPLGRRQPSGRA